jgi:hypothetical protein
VSTLHAWREEARQDRLTQARIDQDRETARLRAAITGREAAARMRREEAQAKAAARDRARKAGAARRAARVAWLSRHVVDLLFVPVVVVPAVLAWTAMAAYGATLYGPAGLTLPALSEGGMWTFAAATTITRRRHPGKPLWHLRLGTAVFAVIGAALNFAHGLTAPATGPAPHGPGIAAVYAVVSVAGVTAHQLVTAGPRRSRAERHASRIAAAITRREHAATRAAVRRAPVELDEHGNARLIFEPGTAVLGRHHGRARLARRDGGPGLTAAGPVCPWPRPVPLMPAPGMHPVTAPGVHPSGAPARPRKSAPKAARNRVRKPVVAEAAEVHFAADLAEGRVPSARRIKTELHLGQARANEIREHLGKVLAGASAAVP